MVPIFPSEVTVVCSCDTHVLCVRPFPSGPGPEYIVWRWDAPDSNGVRAVSSGGYFPAAVWGGEFRALSSALEAYRIRVGVMSGEDPSGAD
jgi:hypothetical protein